MEREGRRRIPKNTTKGGADKRIKGFKETMLFLPISSVPEPLMSHVPVPKKLEYCFSLAERVASRQWREMDGLSFKLAQTFDLSSNATEYTRILATRRLFPAMAIANSPAEVYLKPRRLLQGRFRIIYLQTLSWGFVPPRMFFENFLFHNYTGNLARGWGLLEKVWRKFFLERRSFGKEKKKE